MQLDDDLDFILADQVRLTGQGKVVWDGRSFNVTYDDADEVLLDADGRKVLQDGQVLRCRTALLPSTAKRGDTFMIDGASFTARDIRKQDDGRVTLIEIAKV